MCNAITTAPSSANAPVARSSSSPNPAPISGTAHSSSSSAITHSTHPITSTRVPRLPSNATNSAAPLAAPSKETKLSSSSITKASARTSIKPPQPLFPTQNPALLPFPAFSRYSISGQSLPPARPISMASPKSSAAPYKPSKKTLAPFAPTTSFPKKILWQASTPSTTAATSPPLQPIPTVPTSLISANRSRVSKKLTFSIHLSSTPLALAIPVPVISSLVNQPPALPPPPFPVSSPDFPSAPSSLVAVPPLIPKPPLASPAATTAATCTSPAISTPTKIASPSPGAAINSALARGSNNFNPMKSSPSVNSGKPPSLASPHFSRAPLRPSSTTRLPPKCIGARCSARFTPKMFFASTPSSRCLSVFAMSSPRVGTKLMIAPLITPSPAA